MSQMERITGENAVTSAELERKYLTFLTDEQLFGIPIAEVVQIIGMQKITEIPEFPDYAKGIINLRGDIVPIIDVRVRLCKPVMEYNDRTCIIVTDINGKYYGFVVDRVDEVTEIPDEYITVPPHMGNETAAQYLTGVAKIKEKLVLIMDIRKLLAEQELGSLTQSLYTDEV